MVDWAATASLTVLGVQCAVAVSNVFALRSREKRNSSYNPTVSILVPARNEEAVIGALLNSLKVQTYPLHEVLVLDDGSTDGTAEVAAQHGARVLAGEPLPAGWTGKNWACRQLAAAATGQKLLFLDADVRAKPGFVGAMVEGSEGLNLLSGLPRFEPSDAKQAVLLSMIPYSFLASLPFLATRHARHPGFGFANGQMMLFDAEFYRRLQPHEQVRGVVLEDVAIGRLVKRRGGRLRMMGLRDEATVRMYESFGATVDGLSKNTAQITGSAPATLAVAAGMVFLAAAPLSAGLAGHSWGWLALAIGLVSKLISDRIAGFPVWLSPLLPVGQLLGAAVLLRSVVWHRRGRVAWKGREYNPQ